MYAWYRAHQPGPGTELVERWPHGLGLSAYAPVPGFSATPAAAAGIRGMGCLCGAGCQAGISGLTFDGSGLFGSGIFGTGVTLTDPTTWGVAEWAVIALGLYVVVSLFQDVTRGSKAAVRKGRAVRKALQA